MPYATGRIIHDADSHLMELPDVLDPYLDPKFRAAYDARLARFGDDDDLAKLLTSLRVEGKKPRVALDPASVSAGMRDRVEALIVTRGAEGSRIYTGGEVIDVASVPADALADPTGCGDAYRGGLLYGLAHGADIVASARLASVMGSIKIARRGGQNHAPSRDEVARRHQAAFGTALAF